MWGRWGKVVVPNKIKIIRTKRGLTRLSLKNKNKQKSKEKASQKQLQGWHQSMTLLSLDKNQLPVCAMYRAPPTHPTAHSLPPHTFKGLSGLFAHTDVRQTRNIAK